MRDNKNNVPLNGLETMDETKKELIKEFSDKYQVNLHEWEKNLFSLAFDNGYELGFDTGYGHGFEDGLGEEGKNN